MPKVASLGHVGLYVRDIERSKAFYRDIVGLKISDENPKTGSAFMTAKDRLDEHHELLLIPGREDGKVVQQISFRCSSLDRRQRILPSLPGAQGADYSHRQPWQCRRPVLRRPGW